ncbi:hypothetical protein ACI8AF_19245 [Blastococcus sp. SYSU D00669]
MLDRDELPAELRGAPPAEDAHVPVEAAGAVVSHEERAARSRGGDAIPTEALAAAEAAAERAHLLPAEMRVQPVVEPEVDVADGAAVPPEAGVVAVTHPHRDGG